MNRTIHFSLLLLAFLAAGCSDNHLIRNSEYRSGVQKAFSERKDLASKRGDELFAPFSGKITVREKEALEFLFAYMPLSDLADYDGYFFLAVSQYALKAIDEAPWRDSIPEDIFLHYVLPPRVNNENLDSFRIKCYDEIRNRIRGMDLLKAALEINHWCHEKVSYQPADIRTSAPLSTMLSAQGRCGEESTFTVAALRTAGIPARQVYTPRWAHSDDNHAWVEFWHNGKWHYMGACEPEPVPDKGWFTEPARRAMLVHTKSFGAAYGNENAINIHRNFAEVNNLERYASTKRIYVKVSSDDGKPVPGASVEYKLYNYAEFYTLAEIETGPAGISSFETGFGDLLVWAHLDSLFAFRKISVVETDTLNLILGEYSDVKGTLELDLDVPAVLKPLPLPDTEASRINDLRVAEENAIREKYISTWMSHAEAKSLAVSLGADTFIVADIIKRSKGNHREISRFISSVPEASRNLAIAVLKRLPDKDLRDTPSDILSDHIANIVKLIPDTASALSDFFIDYVASPRVANEIIRPWRSWLLKTIPSETRENAVANPSVLSDYIDSNVILNEDDNYYRTPITPAGVISLGVSDRQSRNICFVAMCRTLGIPARLEPGSLLPQYQLNGKWLYAWTGVDKSAKGEQCYIKLVSNVTDPVPEYYIHFTLARIEGGRVASLEYDYNRKITDFRNELALQPGNFMLVTGNRLPDGKILTSLTFFSLKPGEKITLSVQPRKEGKDPEILGRLDYDEILPLFSSLGQPRAGLARNGVVAIWSDPEKEPSKHVFNDLPLMKKELDRWGGSFLFMTGEPPPENGFYPSGLKNLPERSFFAVDRGFEKLSRIKNICTPGGAQLPYVVVADSKGNIKWISQGYRIGIGEQILRHAGKDVNK